MNFIIKPYDPYEDALQILQKFNATPADEQQESEQEVLQLIAHRISQHENRKPTPA
jgi:hypothetical protein